MFPKDSSYDLFEGIILFSGNEFVPGDIVFSLNDFRKWAIKQSFVTEEDFQFVVPEKVQDLRKCFSEKDKLGIAISIVSLERSKEIAYFEYPYVPIKTLIERDFEIQIIYWRMMPKAWDQNGNVTRFGEVRFGFLIRSCTLEELCSMSTAKQVVEGFGKLLTQLSQIHPVKKFKDGSIQITVDEAVSAKFVRNGRFFDVELTLKRNAK